MTTTMLGLPLFNHGDADFIYNQYQTSRPVDFQIAAIKGCRVAIHIYEGIEQPVMYKPMPYGGEEITALPHWRDNLNDSTQLLADMPAVTIYAPDENDNQWHMLWLSMIFDDETCIKGMDLSQIICEAWLQYMEVISR